MKYTAHINIMPHKELLDPQGKAVNNSLHNLGLTQVADVRIGKHITVALEAANRQEAEKAVDEACKRLLANLVMESFEYSLTEG
ncbi:MAG: phosphoribosylformylglycinamidine synthase [Bacteroidetes bacterium 43-93]|nr:phosphoribosylformylglycinamidine synthase subunit PurS [Bacteroidota bacterium]MBS1778923.1 phosphoribosylformylglycinamidine synthase subunit PurS [Bacteroidota bacterium]OJW97821.1 MAG: phosphoribosylformylglycinamidine synthase [Bacteroidetes bacterium 43-93]